MNSKIAGLVLELNTNTLPPPGFTSNFTFRLAVRKTGLYDLNNVTYFPANHSEEKNYSLFIHRRMLEASKVYKIAVNIR